jgi:hypothetical protein
MRSPRCERTRYDTSELLFIYTDSEHTFGAAQHLKEIWSDPDLRVTSELRAVEGMSRILEGGQRSATVQARLATIAATQPFGDLAEVPNCAVGVSRAPTALTR